MLKGQETFAKYKKLSERLVDLKAARSELSRKLEPISELRKAQQEIQTLKSKEQKHENAMRSSIDRRPPRYAKIAKEFATIVKRVLGRTAVLSTTLNTMGNYHFQAEIVDDLGESTGADEGTSYRKLLCVAFDLAVLSAYSNDDFPCFCFHDGVFEGLDVRKKLNLYEVMNDYAVKGVQQLVTTIDSDLPRTSDDKILNIPLETVVLRLNDSGNSGRLFKMDSW